MRYMIGALSALIVIIGATTANSLYMSSVTGKAIAYVEDALAAGEADDESRYCSSGTGAGPLLGRTA